jgi:hypothetical protein
MFPHCSWCPHHRAPQSLTHMYPLVQCQTLKKCLLSYICVLGFNSVKRKFFPLQKCPHWLWGPPQPLIQWMLRIKWPGCESDHSHKSSAEVRMGEAIPLIPLYSFMAGTETPSPFYSCCSLLFEFIGSSRHNATIQFIPVLWNSMCNIYTWIFTTWSSLY